MPHDESVYPADWLRIAEKDLGRVDKLMTRLIRHFDHLTKRRRQSNIMSVFLLLRR
jgi:hypothetical protein